jgi:predicted metal-dependent TIM-barrel fold hydrolase
MGAYIEHCYLQLTPRSGSRHPIRFVEIVKEIGAERCIMVTDFGWITEPSPAEAMRSFISVMLTFGCTKEEILYMVQTNPTMLLDLDK